jgi:hypothetical protein
MPFPPKDTIKEIGRKVSRLMVFEQEKINSIVSRALLENTTHE